MLRRKVKKISENIIEDDKNSFSLRKQSLNQIDDIELSENNRSEINNEKDTSYNREDIGKWLIKNVFSIDIIDKLKDNLLLPIPNVDSSSSSEDWINMLIKSYFPKEDVLIISNNIYQQNEQIEKYKRLYENSLEQVQEQSNEIVNIKESLEKQKNKTFKLENKVDQMIELSSFVEYNFDGIMGSDKIKILLLEAVNSDSEDLASFIIPFAINSQNIIMLKKYIKDNVNIDTQLYLDEIKILLKSISGKYIPQRKELLVELAKNISEHFKDIKFISPEEYTFVEPKIHNIPSAGGQKVTEGISFAVVRKDTNQTIIYANIKAQ